MFQLQRIWRKRPIFQGIMLLEKGYRFWGHQSFYYDGIYHSLGFYWFVVGWQTADWVRK
jgi:hypothetical protein